MRGLLHAPLIFEALRNPAGDPREVRRDGLRSATGRPQGHPAYSSPRGGSSIAPRRPRAGASGRILTAAWRRPSGTLERDRGRPSSYEFRRGGAFPFTTETGDPMANFFLAECRIWSLPFVEEVERRPEEAAGRQGRHG